MTRRGGQTGRGSKSVGLSLFVFVAALADVVWAEAPAPRDWTCGRCPSVVGWELDIEGGPAFVNEDAFRFGDGTGLDEQGAYFFGDLYARYRTEEAGYLVFEGYARGPDANALFIKAGKQSAYELRASIQSIPRRIFATSVTPYDGNGTDQLTLPADWVRAATTGGMTALNDAAEPVRLGWDRDIYGLGFDVSPTQRWKLRVDYTRQEREGLSRSSGSFFFNGAEFAAPVDDATDDLEVALNYAADTWQVGLTYFGSVFNNQYDDLTWDNPYASAPGADAGQLAQPPDNESHQVSLAGSMRLPARTTLNGQVSFGHMTQNSDLLPYTTNPLLPVNPLPTSSADAEVDTLNLNVRAVSSPWRNVTLEGELRYHDFDNRTPVNGYDYIVTDTVPAAVPVTSSAYDYERREIGLRGEYRLPAGMKMFAGFDNERYERNRQDRSRTTTNRAWFRLRTRLGQRADLDADLFAENRGGSEYTVTDNPAAPENPLMRKYNMADRERNGIRLRGSMYGGERVDFGWELEYSEDRYDNSALGLTDSDYLRLGADVTVLVGTQGSAYASLYNEKIGTDQRNSQSFAEPDWAATTDDRFSTVTLGLAYPGLLDTVDVSLEYTWMQSVGETENNTSGLVTSFPDLRHTRRNIKLGLSYPVSESLSFGFDYFFESVDSDDWMLDGVEPATIPNLLSLGADAWNYNVGTYYLSVEYRL